MTDEQRPKRPHLTRVGPIRSSDGLWGRPGAAAEAKAPGGAPAAVDDVITRSVEVGYRVVDEYIKRGQEAARRMRAGTYGVADAARDVQGVAGQVVRSAADLAGAWAELFALTGGGSGMTGAATTDSLCEDAARASQSATAGADQALVLPRVRVAIAADRPVETSLDLRPTTPSCRLAVPPLRADANAATRITDVVVTDDGDGAVIRITVASDQPPGRYVGVVVDDVTNVPVGDLVVIVSERR